MVVKLVQASRASFIRDLSRKLVALFVLASSLTARAAEQAATPSPTEPRRHVSRLDLADVRFTTPLGNLNPRSGHVPSDRSHLHLDYARRGGLPVRVPAAGRVFAIRGQVRADFKIEVQVNDWFSYYIAHV